MEINIKNEPKITLSVLDGRVLEKKAPATAPIAAEGSIYFIILSSIFCSLLCKSAPTNVVGKITAREVVTA